MAFNRPTLQQLIDRIAADIESRLPGADARTRRSNLAVLARALAGAVHGLYGYLEWQSRQILPDTAEAELLDRHASLHGITRTAAVAATGNVTFTGTNGTVIPAGTELQRSDGVLFTTDAEATIASSSATAAVTCQTLGATGNTDAAVALTLISPIAGLDSQAAVAVGGLSGGTDPETDADLLERLLERIESPPHGGAAADYILWAKQIAGVTRAWVYPEELGPGTVVLRFVRDNDASMIPDAGEVAAVQAHIDTVRPVTAAFTAVAPVAAPLNFTLAVVPNTQAVKDAVTAELLDMFSRDAEPGGTILISRIREAISIAAGETNYVLSTPSADVTHTTGQIATLGTITWA